MNTKRSCFLMTLLASSIIIAEIIIVAAGGDVSACFGVDTCSWLNFNCTENKVIKLKSLEYGKTQQDGCTEGNCVPKKCCSYSNGDCSQPYTEPNRLNVYTRCSGKATCSSQAQRNRINSCGSAFSNYARITFECIDKSNIVSQCRTNFSFGNKTNIHLLLSDFSDCTELFCIATANMGESITVTAVDVRLNKESGSCSSTILKINNRRKDCDPDNFFHNKVVPVRDNKTIDLKITDLFFRGQQDKPNMIWINFKATTDINLVCNTEMREDTVTTQTTGGVSAPAAQSSESTNPVPIVVPVIIVVLLITAVFIAFFLWRKGKCLQKPTLKSLFTIGSSENSGQNKANNYIDPNKISGDRRRTQNELRAVSTPPAGNYLNVEPHYAEPEVRNSTYAEIPEDNCQPEDDEQTISEYDKLGAKRKISELTNNDYSHMKLTDQTPYSHIKHRAHGDGSNHKPLSDYSHIQPGQDFHPKKPDTRKEDNPACTDMSEYSHVANYRQNGETEAGVTVKENAYEYDHTKGNTNMDETDTYSHLHAPKA